MADERKPEKAMAGMLKRQNVWPAASGEACPDASTLAAYFERSLTAAETTQWESHFSTCARCQEQLAAMVRSEPAVAADRKPAFAWAWNWRWMAPVGAAAVVLIFVLSYKTFYTPLQPPSGTELMAKRDAAEPSPAAPAAQEPAKTTAEKLETAAAATPTKKAAPSSDQKKKALAADEAKLKREIAAGTVGSEGQELKDRNAPGAVGGIGAVTSRAVAKQAEPEKGIVAAENRVLVAPPGPANAQNRANELDRAQAAQQAAPSAPAVQQERVVVEAEARAPAAPPPQSADKVTTLQKQRAAEQKSTTASPFAFGGVQRGKSDLRVAPGEIIVSTPTPGVSWRFKDSGLIERTMDGGKTWAAQKIPTKENILTASAPSADVCWAGGSNGVLLRTTDGGATWMLLGSPTKYAVVSLQATADGVVTLTSADGHKFESRDSGAHWRPL